MEENTITFSSQKEFSESDIKFILMLCEELLPPPTIAYITQAKEVKEIPVSSYLDEDVFKMFNQNKYGIEYVSGDEKPNMLLSKAEGVGVINIPLINKDEYHLTKKMVLQLIEGLDLVLLNVSPVDFKSFFRKHYRGNKRTVNFAGLYWLQYYGADEFKKQGGNAILDNPYIDAQLIKDGIFIEVGKSPYEVHTPEGEELMIQANAAMPPVVEG